MEFNVAMEQAALRRLTISQLRERYADLFGDETRTGNRDWLIKRILWRMQARAEGDLSDRARQRANELANDADLRLSPPRSKPAAAAEPTRTITKQVVFTNDNRLPLPGSVLTREYKGRAIQVHVLPKGFEFEGERFNSLTAVAKHITGTHTNGFHFFRLNDREAR